MAAPSGGGDPGEFGVPDQLYEPSRDRPGTRNPEGPCFRARRGSGYCAFEPRARGRVCWLCLRPEGHEGIRSYFGTPTWQTVGVFLAGVLTTVLVILGRQEPRPPLSAQRPPLSAQRPPLSAQRPPLSAQRPPHQATSLPAFSYCWYGGAGGGFGSPDARASRDPAAPRFVESSASDRAPVSPLQIYIVYNKRTGKPRGYAFIEYEHERDMHSAYKHADGKKIDGRRVLVDVERGRTVKGWRPRRLGGGLGGTRRGGADVNIKHSGRDDTSRYDERSVQCVLAGGPPGGLRPGPGKGGCVCVRDLFCFVKVVR
nr:PREDICTED: U1 small nuclear ribonucleoprotein 70 kDa-like [Lepisosteus oculatus]